ncbi:hypothetical protein GCM10009760_10180 [Kitasatospora kazusensis]|uniref:Beta-ketoacyl synthase-like N-terminal domain-containing protein n=1 Tax=Kitasatospora kazusensis TaxID=407974 RepID=A0ABN2YY32_9ACTN
MKTVNSKLRTLSSAQWTAGSTPPAPVPGFIISSFSALAADVADRCLAERYGTAPAPAERGERTAVLLVSPGGDRGTAQAVAELVDNGGRLSPLLFFQSVPNSIAGRITAHWGLTGPVVCTSPAGDPFEDAAELAELLVADGDADEVLVLVVEQTPAGESERATAVLLGAV